MQTGFVTTQLTAYVARCIKMANFEIKCALAVASIYQIPYVLQVISSQLEVL